MWTLIYFEIKRLSTRGAKENGVENSKPFRCDWDEKKTRQHTVASEAWGSGWRKCTQPRDLLGSITLSKKKEMLMCWCVVCEGVFVGMCVYYWVMVWVDPFLRVRSGVWWIWISHQHTTKGQVEGKWGGMWVGASNSSTYLSTVAIDIDFGL